MLRWLFRAALALMVLRMVLVTRRRRATTPPGPPFAPQRTPQRAKWREDRVRGAQVDPRAITDAEYEEIPGAGR